jgi:hypothetical protein
VISEALDQQDQKGDDQKWTQAEEISLGYLQVLA